MKRFLSLFIVLILWAGCLISCSAGSTGADGDTKPPQETASQVSGNDNKPEDNAVQPAQEFKITENDTFAYVDNSGILKLKNLSDGSEKTVGGGGVGVFSYDIRVEDGLAAYIYQINKDSREAKLCILDMKTSASEEIALGDEAARQVDWSKDGRYLAVDHGTSPTGFTRIYDMKDKKWLDVNTPQGNGILTCGYLWSPYDNTMALNVPEDVEPSTPVGDGTSMSIAVCSIENGQYRLVLKGTGDFGYGLIRYADEESVYVEKMFFTEIDRREYYKVNLADGALVQADESEALVHDDSAGLPGEVTDSLYDLSADGKLVLYNVYDEGSQSWKVMLWDISKQQKKEICGGSYPVWIH